MPMIYENQNEAPFKLPDSYVELFQDGWKQWQFRLMMGERVVIQSKQKYKTRKKVEAVVQRLREVLKDTGFCPTLYLPDVMDVVEKSEPEKKSVIVGGAEIVKKKETPKYPHLQGAKNK